MKHLIKKLSKVAPSSTSSSYSLLRSDTLSSTRPQRKTHVLSRHRRCSVPSGHVPVYVGEDMVRFIISTDLMHHPVFITLLNKSAQEYGYEQKGALRIPCNVVVFESVVDALTCGRDLSSEVVDLINSVFNNTSNEDGNNLFF